MSLFKNMVISFEDSWNFANIHVRIARLNCISELMEDEIEKLF